MDRGEFTKRLRNLLTRKTEKRNWPANKQIEACQCLFDQTVIGRHRSLTHGDLARLMHGENTDTNRDAVRQVLKQAIQTIDASPDCGFHIDRDPSDDGTPRFRIVLMTPSGRRHGLHLGRYAGRDGHIETFTSVARKASDRDNPDPVLALHGFGGIGKSTLLELFRHEATLLDIKVRPALERDQIVEGSVSTWLSEIFLFEQGDSPRPTQKWRDFLDVLEPNTLVLVDTTAKVDMDDFNQTFSTLAKVLAAERSDCLIVTATRDRPHFNLYHLPVDGLEPREIALLAQAPDWPEDIPEYAERLHRETNGGNPFILDAICRNEDLWPAFKAGTLDLTRQAGKVTGLLKEMWDSLSDHARDGLTLLSALAVHAPRWQFQWTDADCQALLGSSWPDIHLELTGRRFVRDDGERLVVHELVSEFAFPRLDDPADRFKQIGEHFAADDRALVATRFLAEAERCSRKP